MSTFTPGWEWAPGLYLGSTGAAGRSEPGWDSCVQAPVGCRSVPWGHPGSLCIHMACPGSALCNQHTYWPWPIQDGWSQDAQRPPQHTWQGRRLFSTEGSVKPALSWESWWEIDAFQEFWQQIAETHGSKAGTPGDTNAGRYFTSQSL